VKEGTGLSLGVSPTMLSLQKLEGPFIGMHLRIGTHTCTQIHTCMHTVDALKDLASRRTYVSAAAFS